jgi:DNA-3-methyladenine glycosylase II
MIEDWILKISQRDQVLKALLDRFGPLEIRTRRPEFEDICRIIVSQQLSGSASETIFARIMKFNQGNGLLQPEAILSVSDDELRACGVSYAKVGFMKSAAEKVQSDSGFLSRVSEMTDENALQAMISLKGIGLWSAQIFLLANLGRTNIFPLGDATLERAVRALYGVCPKTEKAHFEEISMIWSPYKSLAARYLWAWVDSGGSVPSRKQ